MRILAIDYSINCPALCYLNGTEIKWYVNYRKDSKSDYPILPNSNIEWVRSYTEDPIDRFIELSEWATKRIAFHLPEVVILEDYAFSGKGKITMLSENIGIFKAAFRRRLFQFKLELVAPTKMKKFATNKGNADKAQIWDAFLQKFPECSEWPKIVNPKSKSVAINSPLADIADSYFLATYGLQKYGITKI